MNWGRAVHPQEQPPATSQPWPFRLTWETQVWGEIARWGSRLPSPNSCSSSGSLLPEASLLPVLSYFPHRAPGNGPSPRNLSGKMPMLPAATDMTAQTLTQKEGTDQAQSSGGLWKAMTSCLPHPDPEALTYACTRCCLPLGLLSRDRRCSFRPLGPCSCSDTLWS